VLVCRGCGGVGVRKTGVVRGGLFGFHICGGGGGLCGIG